MAKNENADGVKVTNKSDLARARDEWLASDEGVKCCRGGTQGRFLKNRIECAFVAGWNFCGELAKLEKSRTLRNKVPARLLHENLVLRKRLARWEGIPAKKGK